MWNKVACMTWEVTQHLLSRATNFLDRNRLYFRQFLTLLLSHDPLACPQIAISLSNFT